ncbi:MAG TPA: hypothetical protein V6D20_14870, partial [Candidatus Obscuribacterales bacterium]
KPFLLNEEAAAGLEGVYSVDFPGTDRMKVEIREGKLQANMAQIDNDFAEDGWFTISPLNDTEYYNTNSFRPYSFQVDSTGQATTVLMKRTELLFTGKKQ